MAMLAEEHARAGFPLPLRMLWLHSTLVAAARERTVPALQQAQWGGLWSFENDQQVAVLRVGGQDYVRAAFVPTQDVSAQDRARGESHGVIAEEVVGSLDEAAGGIAERVWNLADSSMRLPTRKAVAATVTNPGASDHWLHERFIAGGGRPGHARCAIPATDRLSAESGALEHSYAGDPDMQARLARGEWSDLLLGEVVAAGYDPAVHVAATRLVPSPAHMLAIGWDGGHSPSAVIAPLIDGQVRVYAAQNDLNVGVQELIEDQMIPWLITHAPCPRQQRGQLVHVIDPSMRTAGQDSIRHSAERVIYEMLSGRLVSAPPAWAPRREAILRVLTPRHSGGRAALAISPVPETALLRQAFSSRWYYAQTPDGRVDRSRPKKPNSPFSDLGDAAAYVIGWLRPGSSAEDIKRPTTPIYAASTTAQHDPLRRPGVARSRTAW
jgi:hypothetical protein